MRSHEPEDGEAPRGAAEVGLCLTCRHVRRVPTPRATYWLCELAAGDSRFEKYPRLAARRKHPAKVLSGGERRLLEICRALVMNPKVLLVDEPSIGLEPRFISAVFDILGDLQHNEGKTIVMVEQNAKKGLEFSDIGYVLVSGRLALAGKAKELLTDPDVGRLFLGG